MYDLSPIREMTNAWWAGIRECIRGLGLEGVPQHLQRCVSREAQWRSSSLLLSQTCGFPLRHAFKDELQIVLTPCYDFDGCDGPYYRSVIVVARNDPAHQIDDLTGMHFAVNSRDSWSGWHALLRELKAKRHDPKQFIGGVTITGSHQSSMRAVANGEARAAAIDCVTYGLLARHAPQALIAMRVLAKTRLAPALPYVTHTKNKTQHLDLLRQALACALQASATARARTALGICGFQPLSFSDYAPMASAYD